MNAELRTQLLATTRSQASEQVFDTVLPRITLAGDPEAPAVFVERDLLGQGGMGVVMAADQPSLYRSVAIKSVPRILADDGQFEAALLFEARVMGMLEHPNIIPVYAIGRDESGRALVVMKKIVGDAWSRSLSMADRDLKLSWHLDVLMAVSQAVAYAHSHGVLHRDLKPQNVLIGAFGETYVCDWGTAIGFGDEAPAFLPKVGGAIPSIGTPAYMAPEMATGDGDALGPWTDVYLLGAMLYHVIEGAPPHVAESPLAALLKARKSELTFSADAPQQLVDICRCATYVDTAARFPTVDAFRQALVEFGEHRSSANLASKAHGLVADLRRSVEGGEHDTQHIDRIFWEARFACRRALEEWPDNVEANHTLQQGAGLMTRAALDRGDHLGARRHLAEMTAPPPELAAQVQAAADDAEAQSATFEILKAEAKDRDLSVEAKRRATLTAALAISFSSVEFTHAIMTLTGTKSDTVVNIVTMFALCVMAAVTLYMFRALFTANLINRSWLLAVVATFVLAIITQLTGMQRGLPIEMTVPLGFAVGATGFAVIGVLVDKRAFAASAAYILADIAAIRFVDHPSVISGFANMLALGSYSALWWWTARRARAVEN